MNSSNLNNFYIEPEETLDYTINPGIKFIIRNNHENLPEGTIVEAIQSSHTHTVLTRKYNAKGKHTYLITIGLNADFLNKTKEDLLLELKRHKFIHEEIAQRIDYMEKVGTEIFERNKYKLWLLTETLLNKRISKEELYEIIVDIMSNDSKINRSHDSNYKF